MRNYCKLFIAALTVCVMVSCIRKEPLNAECDITAVALDGDVLNRAPIIENNKVTLIVKNGVDVTKLAPRLC